MNTFSKIMNIGAPNPSGPTMPVTCPACRREGNFAPLGHDVSFNVPAPHLGPNRVRQIGAGHRLCPNYQCATHVFVVYEGGRVISSYPAGRIDFDGTDVPERVFKAFDEALSCTANECYVGAAMLIRKTLEAVCEERQAVGKNLKDRILELQNKVTLPKDLFDAMGHLRLLGNDAAHIESKDYDTIGKDEVEAGIALTKEIIKATYQYRSLVGKLTALKKPGAQAP